MINLKKINLRNRSNQNEINRSAIQKAPTSLIPDIDHSTWLVCLCLPTISAILLFAAFPPFSWWLLSFIALIPILFPLFSKTAPAKKLLCGFIFGFIYSALMGYWIANTLMLHYQSPVLFSIFFVMIAICLPLGFLYTLLGVGFALFKGRSRFFCALATASLWIVIEYLKEIIPLLLPWGAIAYATLPWQSFVQMADLGGLYGVSFVTVLINVLGYYLVSAFWRLRGENKKLTLVKIIRQIRYPFTYLILLLVIPHFYGVIKQDQIKSLDNKAHKDPGTLVQGNFDLKDRWSGLGFYQRLATYLKLSENLKRDGKRLILWPETVLNSREKLDINLFKGIIQRIGKDSVLVTGGLRETGNGNGVYNSAYVISGQGSVQWYDKRILLPYSEYSPFKNLLQTFYQAPDKFESGDFPAAIKTKLGKLGLSICFEILYPYAIRNSVKNGSRVLINISNDAWFAGSAMPFIHLQSATMRAIETRRFLLRVSNSGFSAIVSPLGTVTVQSKLDERIRLDGEFTLLDTTSFYVQMGDWILLLACTILGIGLLSIILQKT